jgi:hypothetical protein
MNNNTNYYYTRGACYDRRQENVNYGQTGVIKTNASACDDHCWFVPDGSDDYAIKLETKYVYTQDVGYIDGTEFNSK